MSLARATALDAPEGVSPAFCPEGEVVAARAACPQDGRQADDGKVEPAQHQGLSCVAPFVHLLRLIVTIFVVHDDVTPQGDSSGNAWRIVQPYAAVVLASVGSVAQRKYLSENVLGELPHIEKDV